MEREAAVGEDRSPGQGSHCPGSEGPGGPGGPGPVHGANEIDLYSRGVLVLVLVLESSVFIPKYQK